MKSRIGVLAALLLLGQMPMASAFGLGDLVGVAIQAGAKLGGAAVDSVVDSAKDALRDPEAEAAKKREEERKVIEAFERAKGAIEDNAGLSPLQKERQILTLTRQYEQMQVFQRYAQEAEVQRRAERDMLFTVSGLAGVAADAAMSSPSMVMARADAMVKAGIPQAQGRAAITGAEALVRTGIPQAQGRAAIAGAEAIAGTPSRPQIGQEVLAKVGDVARNIQNQPANGPSTSMTVSDIKPNAVDVPLSDTPALGPQSTEAAPAMEKTDAFASDRGRTLYVEFVGSQTLTGELRRSLLAKGYSMAEKPDQAMVNYRIEGEFVVSGTKQYSGMRLDVGGILENPQQEIPLPEQKLSGKLGLGVSRLLFGLASAQGSNVPKEIAPRDQTTFKQEVLLVLARMAEGERETRIAVVKQTEQGALQALALAQDAVADLGLPLNDSKSALAAKP